MTVFNGWKYPLDTASYLYATWLAMYPNAYLDGWTSLEDLTSSGSLASVCGCHLIMEVLPPGFSDKNS